MSRSQQSTKDGGKLKRTTNPLKAMLRLPSLLGKLLELKINHLFASQCAYIQLESMVKVIGMNHFALKQKIYIESLKTAMHELQKLATQTIFQTENMTGAHA